MAVIVSTIFNVAYYTFTDGDWMMRRTRRFDGSWGYQNTGFFAPTARYGTAAELMALVDRLHGAGIGAILDFVPVHFAVDGYGLRMDAVSRLLYWQGDETRGENGMTVNFLKVMNMGLRRLHPTAMLIAEDSSVYPDETREPDWELLKLPAHGASSAH